MDKVDKVTLIFEGIGENNIDESKIYKDMRVNPQYYKRLLSVGYDYLNRLSYKYRDTSDEEMNTVRAWIKRYVLDYSLFKYIDKKYKYDEVAAYSIGLITSLACLESISFEDGLKLVGESYFYSKGYNNDEMLMLFEIGINKDNINELIVSNRMEGKVFIAANISENYVLLSGIKKEVRELAKIIRDNGALKVSIIQTPTAFHTDLAKPGIEILNKLVYSMNVRDSKTPICSMYSKKYIFKAEDLKKELCINIYRKMDVNGCFKKFLEDDKFNFVEVGLFKAIEKTCREIDKRIVFL